MARSGDVGGAWAGGLREDALRAEHLFLILNIIKQASRTFNPETFFNLLVETIFREVKTFSHVSIFGWDSKGALVRELALAGEADSGKSATVERRAVGALAEALKTGATYVSNDLRREPRGLRPLAGLSRSALCIPIRSGERIEALLNIESRDAGAFSAQEVALFEILAEHLSNFLHGIRLYEEITRKNAKIQRVNEICRRVFGAAALQEALEIAVRSVVDEYGYFCACVAFVDEEGRMLTLAAHHARTPTQVQVGYRQEMTRGLVGRAATGRSTVCCNDTRSEPDYVSLVPGVLSELCVPLLAGERLIGVLDINAATPEAFGAEDIGLMETLGHQLALVMEKSRFLDRTTQARDYLENLIAGAGDGILVLDLDGRITRWNRGMERLMGYTPEEILGSHYSELPAQETLERSRRLFERARDGEILEWIEDQAICRDGRLIDVSLTMSPVRGGGGEVEGVSVIVRDITARKRIEENLQAMHRQITESEEKFLSVVEKAPDAVFFVDTATGAIILANAMALSQTGLTREAILGRSYLELHPDSDRRLVQAHFEKALATGAGPPVEIRLLRESGRPGDACNVEVIASILNYGGRNAVQWLCRDISEQRRAERDREVLQQQLLQSEKLSAIGQLISGVAHELNNPLTGVIGYSQILTSLECDERIRRGAERVYTEARRCHRIVQNLLTFARKHAPEKTPLSINDVVESTLELRAYQLRVDNIRVEKHLSKELPRTMADFHQLQQVFMNIFNNAHQAMKEAGGGGTLTIRTSAGSGLIRVLVEDTGPGIAPENLSRIFDPFFTTKETGQGTGLGLSICFGIIEEHGGRISVDSAPGRGTKFTLDLPVQAPIEKPVAGVFSEGRERGDWQGGRARLLVVDDEPSILDVVSETLKACGHDVETAVNGRLALRMILDAEYDAVITDLKMPEMSGQDLFSEVRKLRPGQAEKFLFATGDTVAVETRDFLHGAGKPWIEKPFDINHLVAMLGRVLAGAA